MQHYRTAAQGQTQCNYLLCSLSSDIYGYSIVERDEKIGYSSMHRHWISMSADANTETKAFECARERVFTKAEPLPPEGRKNSIGTVMCND